VSGVDVCRVTRLLTKSLWLLTARQPRYMSTHAAYCLGGLLKGNSVTLTTTGSFEGSVTLLGDSAVVWTENEARPNRFMQSGA